MAAAKYTRKMINIFDLVYELVFYLADFTVSVEMCHRCLTCNVDSVPYPNAETADFLMLLAETLSGLLSASGGSSVQGKRYAKERAEVPLLVFKSLGLYVRVQTVVIYFRFVAGVLL
jgi:hypothetical protein